MYIFKRFLLFTIAWFAHGMLQHHKPISDEMPPKPIAVIVGRRRQYYSEEVRRKSMAREAVVGTATRVPGGVYISVGRWTVGLSSGPLLPSSHRASQPQVHSIHPRKARKLSSPLHVYIIIYKFCFVHYDLVHLNYVLMLAVLW